MTLCFIGVACSKYYDIVKLHRIFVYYRVCTWLVPNLKKCNISASFLFCLLPFAVHAFGLYLYLSAVYLTCLK